MAQELNNIRINKHNKIITLNIKDLYVKIPIKNILHVTIFWLKQHNNDNTITEETLHLLKITLKQNYFSIITNFSNPKKELPWDHPFQAP
jgi:hypothetical protein